MTEDAKRRICEEVRRAKTAMLIARQIAEEQPQSRGLWKKLDTLTGKIEALQHTSVLA